MRRAAPVHYLRPNHTSWTPPAIVSFDTETAWETDDGREVHTLRVWAAILTDRRKQVKVTPGQVSASGTTAEELAFQLHAWSAHRRTIWVYAHNLHFDLCVSSLIENLRSLRWQVTDFAVDGAVPFVRLARGDNHLVIADSWSWFPVPLAKLCPLTGIEKPPLPAGDDSEAAWLTRCEADTAILSAALLTLMEWWDSNDLGRWSITGGTSGWNVMRHIPTHRRILIDPDPAKVRADRLAIYGGRRGMWHTGDLPPGRYAELDLERAYTTVARDLPLPVERLLPFDSLPINHHWLNCDRYGVIARVEIETTVARWPVRVGRRVWYPVGRFWTTLAGPEIAEARRLGCLRSVGPGTVHKLGYSLRPWALWCLAAQGPGREDVPAVARITLKHWGRTVIGKWAQRGYTRVQLGAAPTNGWGFIEGWNHGDDVKASIVDFGGTRWQVSASGEADNAYPAILAFVESYVRVALGRVIEAIGDARLVSCDTDGVLAMALSDARLGRAIAAAAPFRLREKGWYRQVRAIGPQHAVLDGHRRFAGVPASAELAPDGKLTALLWPKLAWQMRHGRQGAYVRPSQDYRMAATYAPGWVLADGAVRPVEVRTDTAGTPHLGRWGDSSLARPGARLGPDQHPDLRRYIDAEGDAGNPAHRSAPGARHGGLRQKGVARTSETVPALPARPQRPVPVLRPRVGTGQGAHGGRARSP